jgi:membrane protein YqaA with SNARE-associated domain
MKAARWKNSAAVSDWLLGRRLPLMVRLALFIVFTFITVISALLLLPHLVILGPWGYLAGFFINLLGTAAIVVPVPGLAGVMVMATQLDPILLGIAAGIGGTFGELTGYWLGAQGRQDFSNNRFYTLGAATMNRGGGGLLFAFGLLPFLPVDLAGFFAGASNYPMNKFLIYVGLGKVLMSVFILYLTARAFEWAQPYLSLIG